MLKTEDPPPGHGDAMETICWIGLGATTIYQLLYTLPRWTELVARPLSARRKHPLMAGMLSF